MRKTRVGALGASAVLLLSGCQEAPEPSSPPTSEETRTTVAAEPDTGDQPATSEPMEREAKEAREQREEREEREEATETTEEPEADAPPQLPADATKQTEAGAAAFVEHYIELLNRAYMTDDEESARALSGPECLSCEGLIEDATGFETPEDYVVAESTTSAVVFDDGARVQITINQLQGAGRTEIVVRLTPADDGWVVDEITLVE